MQWKKTKNVKNTKEKINKRKTKEKIIKKTLIIILIIYFINIFTIYSFAKYVYSNEQIHFFKKIANPVFLLYSSKQFEYNKNTNSAIYEFNIQNFNEYNISDVNFKYYIQIQSNINDEISYNLYLDEKDIKIIDNKSESIIINNDSKKIQKFRLKIKFKDENAINKLTNIKIVIYAAQIYK